jgi:hypothetical protein
MTNDELYKKFGSFQYIAHSQEIIPQPGSAR